MNIKSMSVPLAKQVEKEIRENPYGVVVVEALIYKAIEAAQQSVQRTASGRSGWIFLVGYILGVLNCWLLFGSR